MPVSLIAPAGPSSAWKPKEPILVYFAIDADNVPYTDSGALQKKVATAQSIGRTVFVVAGNANSIESIANFSRMLQDLGVPAGDIRVHLAANHKEAADDLIVDSAVEWKHREPRARICYILLSHDMRLRNRLSALMVPAFTANDPTPKIACATPKTEQKENQHFPHRMNRQRLQCILDALPKKEAFSFAEMSKLIRQHCGNKSNRITMKHLQAIVEWMVNSKHVDRVSKGRYRISPAPESNCATCAETQEPTCN